MSKGNLMGFALFGVFIIIRYCVDDYIPDDASTIWMKHVGIYQYVIAGGFLFIIACLIFCVIGHRKNEQLYEQLQKLDALKAHLLAHPERKSLGGKKFCPDCGKFH